MPKSAFPALAALVLSLAAQAAPGDAQVLSRIEPDYPREAVQANVDKGHVKARMTVDGSGQVSRVEILEASPRRLFDRVVVRSLSQWKFNPGNEGRIYDIALDFRR